MHLSYARLPKAHNHLARRQERGADDDAGPSPHVEDPPLTALKDVLRVGRIEQGRIGTDGVKVRYSSVHSGAGPGKAGERVEVMAEPLHYLQATIIFRLSGSASRAFATSASTSAIPTGVSRISGTWGGIRCATSRNAMIEA
jgi:hypothetical protein